MTISSKNMDKLFRDKLTDYPISPPADSWNRLEEELDKKRNTIILPFIKFAAAVLLLAGVGVIIKNTQRSVNTTSTITAGHSVEQNMTEHKAEIKNATSSNKGFTGITAIRKKDASSSTISTYSETAPGSTVTFDTTPAKVLPTPDSSIKHSHNELARNNYNSTESDTLQTEPLVYSKAGIVENQVANKQPPSKKVGWSVSGHAGPQYSYRYIESADGISSSVYNQSESGLIAYAGGIQVEIEPARRISVQSGIYYSKIGQEIQSQSTAYVIDGVSYNYNGFESVTRNDVENQDAALTGVRNSIGYIPEVEPQRIATEISNNIETEEIRYTTTQSFEYIELPLVVSYKLIDRKFAVSINSGLWANILIGNKVVINNLNAETSVESFTENVNTYGYSSSFGLGFDYPITSKIAVSIDPVLKYYLLPINNNSVTTVHPYTLSVLSGLKYTF